MPRAKRICGRPGCPKPVAKRYCTQHDAEYEAKRGTKKERGYGADFWAARRYWVDEVNRGGVACWRCKKPLQPGQSFDLGHDDDDRSIIRGPECPRCNRSAGGRKGRAMQT